MVSSTGTAVLTRSGWSEPARTEPPAAARPSTPYRWSAESPAAFGGSDAAGPAVAARTAAGARAMRRRRTRMAADRRPPSGVLPSGLGRSAVVTADRGDEVADRLQPVGRWVRLACTLCFTATAVLVAVVLLSAGGARVVGPVVVQPGDTLWSVAQRADPGTDPRAVIDRIKELNGLQGDSVGVGVVLQVPVLAR
jgi:LysM repeat protein